MVTDLEIKGPPVPRRTVGTQRQPAWGPGLSWEWGQCPPRPAARQSLCRWPGPSVLQQEVGGHVKVIIGSSQGFQSVAPRKSHLHESGDLKTETKPEV